MLTSLIYYLVLKNLDWTFGRKVSIGMLLVFVLYYTLYYGFIENTIYQPWMLWIIILDVFGLGVMLMKYKNMKFKTFANNALQKTIQ